jgi:hypothetical protein
MDEVLFHGVKSQVEGAKATLLRKAVSDYN